MTGTVTPELRECSGCGYWAHWRNQHGRCRNCVHGWTACPVHGRLEHTGDPAAHRKITVGEVLAAIPQQVRVIR